jgi:ankyrin repeat protein
VGQTPLHWASEKGHIEIVRALLEAGAGVDVRKYDEDGLSPISYACKGKHFEVFRALVEAGGDVNKLDSRGRTALHHASLYGLTEGVRYLCVERGADVNKSTTGGVGHTPLTLASWMGHVEAARVLLEAGADVNKRTTGGDGHTPLTVASMNGRVEAVRVLLEAGADVNKRRSDGKSPLYLALDVMSSQVYDWQSEQTKQDKVKVVALLREAGAQEPTALELQQLEQEIAQLNAHFEEGSEEEPEEDY